VLIFFDQKWMLMSIKIIYWELYFINICQIHFLIKVYDLIYDEKPETLKIALEAYKEALEDESAEEIKRPD